MPGNSNSVSAAPIEQFAGAYTDEFVEIDGLRLHHTDWSPPPGAEPAPPVVLLHGLNVQSHTWDPAALELSRTRRVICPDLRGHGESDWSRDGYYLRDFVSDIVQLVDRLEVPRFDLAGHSLGSRVAIVLAGEHPERVGKLVLSDAGPEFPPEAIEFANRVVSSAGGDVRGFEREEDALDYYRRMHPEWRPVFWDLHVRHQLRRNWCGQLVFRADPDLFWLLGVAGREDDAYVWAMVDRLTMPCLILWGERSPFFNEDIAQRMLARMRDGRLVRTPTGHYIPRESPDAFCRIVREFLDG